MTAVQNIAMLETPVTPLVLIFLVTKTKHEHAKSMNVDAPKIHV
jgi:hypothetical protein